MVVPVLGDLIVIEVPDALTLPAAQQSAAQRASLTSKPLSATLSIARRAEHLG